MIFVWYPVVNVDGLASPIFLNVHEVLRPTVFEDLLSQLDQVEIFVEEKPVDPLGLKLEEFPLELQWLDCELALADQRLFFLIQEVFDGPKIRVELLPQSSLDYYFQDEVIALVEREGIDFGGKIEAIRLWLDFLMVEDGFFPVDWINVEKELSVSDFLFDHLLEEMSENLERTE